MRDFRQSGCVGIQKLCAALLAVGPITMHIAMKWLVGAVLVCAAVYLIGIAIDIGGHHIVDQAVAPPPSGQH